MSVLDGFTSAWVRQRPPALRAGAWIAAVIGPALLTLPAQPMQSALGVGGGFLFAALLLAMATAVVGGIRPALTAVALAAVARIFFFTPPFDQGASKPPNVVPLVGFMIAGVAVSMLIASLARRAGEQAALRRVATLVAHSVPEEQLFAVATEEAGRLVGANYVRMGRYESGELVVVAAWSRTAGRFPAGGRWSAVLGFAGSFTPAPPLGPGSRHFQYIRAASGGHARIRHQVGGQRADHGHRPRLGRASHRLDSEKGAATVHRRTPCLLRRLARDGNLERRKPGRHHPACGGADGIAASGDAGGVRRAPEGGVRCGH